MKIALGIILIISFLVLKTVWQSGAFTTVTDTFSGTFLKIEGLPGVEDLTIDQSTGIAFLSSDDRWSAMIRKQPVKGAIYKLDLNDSLPTPVNLTNGFSQEDFHPHGISLYQTQEGKKVLFVINHTASGNFIEIFEHRNDSLMHVDRISHELIVSPNDLVAVGERSFYVTNDHNEKKSGWRNFKDLLGIGTGNVCYYDGNKVSSTSVKNIRYANGINVSANGKKLYLAATTKRSIFVYDRDLTSGALTLSAELETKTGVDNIEMDPEGNLWVGCHPKLLKFLSHSKDEDSLSPSQIIKVTDLGHGKFEQKTVYMNDGSEISASSVGAVYKDRLLIGPVFQRHIILGKMK